MANKLITPPEYIFEYAKRMQAAMKPEPITLDQVEDALDAVCDKHITKSDNLITKTNS